MYVCMNIRVYIYVCVYMHIHTNDKNGHHGRRDVIIAQKASERRST